MTIYFARAEDTTCSTAESDPDKKRLCFFALNGPAEHETIEEKTTGHRCFNSEGTGVRCYNSGEAEGEDEVELEIKEFYADAEDNNSVSEAFEKMTNTRCDGLVISGHHVGYYTGGRTDQDKDAQGNRDDKVALNLNFLEKLSCLQGDTGGTSDCRKWFSNIKYVHLHGSHTSGHEVLKIENKRQKDQEDQENIEIKTVDDLALSKMRKYGPENWTKASAQYLNREYASTVDENNSLSSRYLKMFPSAQIYSWAVAPTIEQNSPKTFLDHLKLMKAHMEIAATEGSESGPSDESSMLENILTILSTPEPEPKCIKLTVGNLGGIPISSISEPNKAVEDNKRKIGCDFSEAIESKDTDTIIKALEEVLNSGTLHQNLNRIFYALNNDSPLSAETKKAIRNKLKENGKFRTALEEQAGSPKIGVVKRADALYLYKQIYSANEQFGDLENQFVGDLISLYEKQKDGDVGKAMKGMIAEIIWKNNLGSSTTARGNINTLMERLNADDDMHIKQHAELVRVSSGLYTAEDSNKVKDIFNKLFELESNKEKERESWFFVKMWTHLRMQNGGDLTPLQEMYDLHLKELKAESDSTLQNKLNDKRADIIAGVSESFAVKKEECLSSEFPLGEEKFKVIDSDREWMKGVWEDSCRLR